MGWNCLHRGQHARTGAQPGTGPRLKASANLPQVLPPKVRTGPSGSLESRTAILPPRAAASGQLPLARLREDLTQRVSATGCGLDVPGPRPVAGLSACRCRRRVERRA